MACILVAKESVEDYHSKTQEEGIIIKLDLEKAYDYMECDFLDNVMACKGFGS